MIVPSFTALFTCTKTQHQHTTIKQTRQTTVARNASMNGHHDCNHNHNLGGDTFAALNRNTPEKL